MFSHRVSILTGHYGTGKTEVSVNLALALAAEGEQVMLADLDIVNPYFRSRERRALLETAGLGVVFSFQACSGAGVPALPEGRGGARGPGARGGGRGPPPAGGPPRDSARRAELRGVLENRGIRGILDIGGDPVGARVLARFQPKIVQEDYQLIFVLNANRPEVREAESAVAYLRSIEAVTGLTCSGLVNNTHLCGETTPAEIRKGAALAEEVSRQTGIPVLCHTAEQRFLESLSDLREPVFPIAINMKKPWER